MPDFYWGAPPPVVSPPAAKRLRHAPPRPREQSLTTHPHTRAHTRMYECLPSTQALVSLQTGQIAPPGNVFATWRTSLDTCLWDGVYCGNNGSRVDGLSLPRRGFTWSSPGPYLTAIAGLKVSAGCNYRLASMHHHHNSTAIATPPASSSPLLTCRIALLPS